MRVRHEHSPRDLRPLFFDESVAVVANTNSAQRGRRVHLALTDPDSNEDVPADAARFAGDFMLTSQGDEEQIFVAGAGGAHQSLSVLKLSASVDDTAWPSGPAGSLYTTDNGNDTVERVTGPFRRGSVVVATTPCRRELGPQHLPGPGVPGQLPGSVEPGHRGHQPGGGVRGTTGAAGHAVPAVTWCPELQIRS